MTHTNYPCHPYLGHSTTSMSRNNWYPIKASTSPSILEYTYTCWYKDSQWREQAWSAALPKMWLLLTTASLQQSCWDQSSYSTDKLPATAKNDRVKYGIDIERADASLSVVDSVHAINKTQYVTCELLTIMKVLDISNHPVQVRSTRPVHVDIRKWCKCLPASKKISHSQLL